MAYFNYLFVLITFAFIISTGIHIFSRGFLLTRSTRVEKRTCDKYLISLDGNQCLSNDKVNSDVIVMITVFVNTFLHNRLLAMAKTLQSSYARTLIRQQTNCVLSGRAKLSFY